MYGDVKIEVKNRQLAAADPTAAGTTIGTTIAAKAKFPAAAAAVVVAFQVASTESSLDVSRYDDAMSVATLSIFILCLQYCTLTVQHCAVSY